MASVLFLLNTYKRGALLSQCARIEIILSTRLAIACAAAPAASRCAGAGSTDRAGAAAAAGLAAAASYRGDAADRTAVAAIVYAADETAFAFATGREERGDRELNPIKDLEIGRASCRERVPSCV